MKKLAIALGAVLVAAGVAAMHLGQELRAQREQNSVALAHLTALEAGNASGSMVTAPVEVGTQGATQIATPGAVSNALLEQAAAASPGRAQTGSGAESALKQMADKIRSSPEGQELQRMMMRQSLEEEFPNLAKDMHLTPEKVGKLLDLLTRRRMENVMDGLGGDRGPKDRAAREELARARAERNLASEAELKALLGDNYPNWNAYEQAAQDRRREEYTRAGKEQLRSAIESGGNPLTDIQFRSLDSALDAEQKRIDQATTSIQQQMQQLPESNRRLLEVAKMHLNPQQLEGYRSYLKQLEDMMQMVGSMGLDDTDD